MPIRPFALERYFAEYEFSAELLLCSSDVEPYALRELLALAEGETRALWDGLSLGYTETAGHPLLRAEIAALYPGLEADDVLVFAGAQEAIFAFAQAALGGDDHAVVVTPAYQSLHEVARAAGAEVSTVELEHDSGWALDLDDVRRALRPDTSAIVVNFPTTRPGRTSTARPSTGSWRSPRRPERTSSPTRSTAGSSTRPRRCCRAPPSCRPRAEPRRDVEDLRPARAAHRLAGLPRPRAAGAHRGHQGLHDDLQQRPSEILALIGLRRRDEVVARSRAIVDANLPLLDEFFARWEGVFDWVRPRGAAIGFPRLVADVAIDDFARELVDEEGVLILPGSIYEHPGNHFRIGFGRRNMPEALARLERFASARL